MCDRECRGEKRWQRTSERRYNIKKETQTFFCHHLQSSPPPSYRRLTKLVFIMNGNDVEACLYRPSITWLYTGTIFSALSSISSHLLRGLKPRFAFILVCLWPLATVVWRRAERANSQLQICSSTFLILLGWLWQPESLSFYPRRHCSKYTASVQNKRLWSSAPSCRSILHFTSRFRRLRITGRTILKTMSLKVMSKGCVWKGGNTWDSKKYCHFQVLINGDDDLAWLFQVSKGFRRKRRRLVIKSRRIKGNAVTPYTLNVWPHICWAVGNNLDGEVPQ